MYGDKIYCINCKKLFFDTWTSHDSRVDNIELKCPHCKSINVLNATYLIEQYKNTKNIQFNVEQRIIYSIIKKAVDKSKIKLKRKADVFYTSKDLKKLRL
jgi:phage FluMu protein Com